MASMTTDGQMASSTSYGDYEHQLLEIDVQTGTDEGQNVFNNVSFEPLDSRGGLESDEVAELVGFYATVSLARDTVDETESGGLYEFRGVFGANLSDSDITGSPPTGTNAADEQPSAPNRIVRRENDAGDNDGAFTNVNEVLEQGVFLQYDIVSGTDGETVTYERNMRETYGRGPVLDATDDLGSVHALIRQDGTLTAAEGIIQIHLIWDIATVEGVRNRFSVPRQLE